MLNLASLTQLDLHGVLERAELPDRDHPAVARSASIDDRLASAMAIVELGHPTASQVGTKKPSPSTKKGTEKPWT